MSLAMSKAEREAFLAGVHVGVLAIPEPGRGPLNVPIWYGYEPGGEVWVITDANSRKGRLLRRDVRVSLVAQTESPPYQYVSVEGPVVSLEPQKDRALARALAHRYFGVKRGDAYIAATARGGEDDASILVRIRPERWLSVDYGKWGSQ